MTEARAGGATHMRLMSAAGRRCRPRSHRLTEQGRDEKTLGRRPHGVGSTGRPGPGSKPAGKRRATREALVEAAPVVARAQRRPARGRPALGPMAAISRCSVSDRAPKGERVAPGVEQLPLGPSPRRQADGPDTAVGGPHADADQPVRLERAQQPAEVAGVQAEPGAQRPDVAAVRTDLPQHTGGAERPVPGQVALVERADALRDGPVEPPHPGDGGVLHFPDLSQRSGRRATRYDRPALSERSDGGPAARGCAGRQECDGKTGSVRRPPSRPAMNGSSARRTPGRQRRRARSAHQHDAGRMP